MVGIAQSSENNVSSLLGDRNNYLEDIIARSARKKLTVLIETMCITRSIGQWFCTSEHKSQTCIISKTVYGADRRHFLD